MSHRKLRGFVFMAWISVFILPGWSEVVDQSGESQAEMNPQHQIEHLSNDIKHLRKMMYQLSDYARRLEGELEAVRGELARVQEISPKYAPVILHTPVAGMNQEIISRWALMGPRRSSADRNTESQLQKIEKLDFQHQSLLQVIEYFRNQSKLMIVMDWPALENVGIEMDSPVTLHVDGVTYGQALTMILDQLMPGDLDTVDYQVQDGVVRVSTLRKLNQDREVHVYDIGELIDVAGLNRDLEDQKSEQLQELIRDTVGDPLGWSDRGGEIAHMRLYEGKLIVLAPRDYHFQLIRLLEKLD